MRSLYTQGLTTCLFPLTVIKTRQMAVEGAPAGFKVQPNLQLSLPLGFFDQFLSHPDIPAPLAEVCNEHVSNREQRKLLGK